MSEMDAFKKNFSGEVILPDDAAYEAARSTYGKKGSPAVVVRPVTADDVAAAIRYAGNRFPFLSIRSGGHGSMDFGTGDGGMVIDLSNMNSVELADPVEAIVRVGAGATWGRVSGLLKEYGLALSSGDTKSVGVGGLTLGGGIGWMVRKYGLALDRLRAVEMVTAAGRVLRADREENPDLFWAVRGGGGNFGVVTKFEFTAFPLGKVVSGNIGYGLESADVVLKTWRDAMRKAPEELCSTLMVMPAFMGNPAGIMVRFCFAGEDEKTARAAIEPLLQPDGAVLNDLAVRDYPDILEEPHEPPESVRLLVKNAFVNRLEDGLLDALTAAVGAGTGAMIQIRNLNGAFNRIPPDATAFAHRASEALVIYAAFVPADLPPEAGRAALKPWDAIAPFGTGSYVNFLATVTEEDIAFSYPGETYERLKAVKRKYDPENLFCRNCNIRPDRG